MSDIKQQLAQHKYALLLIALLVVAKFIVVPTLAWQDATIENNRLLAKRVQKSEFAVNNQQLATESADKLVNQITLMQGLLFKHQSKSRFQLAEQKKIETLFSEHDIKITRLAWQKMIPTPEWGVTHFELRVDIEGELYDLHRLHVALESQTQWYGVENFNFKLEKLRKREQGIDLGKVTGRMNIKLFMQDPNNGNKV
ncbi:hypothetical protein DXX93_05650 [Thalassotalea euphylliae]|uniref:Uncharacterized protein n=1 Tax=Thalassotalea euphylliae TaxID=1655234 RepID=A0A3E0TP84_9GAMM|nr:hypothetical protein [Thalassotalea euphylliae]REL26110.1 hypothetical protein DXX93_05650 [Thalassotalea euphylliae]